MTRRGSLVYYLAAWVCGCLFMSLAVWLPHKWEGDHWTPGFRGASGFLFFYFLALIFGAFTALTFAFLLRRILTALRWRRTWQWMLMGAGLAELLVWSFFRLSRATPLRPPPLEFFLFLLLGPFRGLREWPAWVNPLVGAATAFVLCHINKSFEPRTQNPEQASI